MVRERVARRVGVRRRGSQDAGSTWGEGKSGSGTRARQEFTSSRAPFFSSSIGGHVVRGNGGSAREGQTRTQCVVDTPQKNQKLHTWSEARQHKANQKG